MRRKRFGCSNNLLGSKGNCHNKLPSVAFRVVIIDAQKESSGLLHLNRFPGSDEEEVGRGQAYGERAVGTFGAVYGAKPLGKNAEAFRPGVNARRVGDGAAEVAIVLVADPEPWPLRTALNVTCWLTLPGFPLDVKVSEVTT